jgi:predicted HTH transcriptional regulator
MEAMMHLELTFCGFEGTRRMRSAMRASSLPEPKFRQVEAHAHQVHAILENDIATRRAQAMGQPFEEISEHEFMALSSEERAIVSFLRSASSVNVTRVSLITGTSWPTASKLIGGLVDKGILTSASPRRRKHDSTKTYALRQRANKTPE